MNKNQRGTFGQSAVEFALVLPLILLLFLLFIDMGRLVYFHSALYNAVREGARYAVVTQFSNSTQRDADIQQKVVGYSIAVPLNSSDVSIWCDRDPTNTTENPCGEFVTVSAQAEIQPVIFFLAWAIGGEDTFNIKAETTMQMTPYGSYSD
jgi:Flp pilus assembly protein TadG